jgi:crossover junction endodeoxyribonuclease RuvC
VTIIIGIDPGLNKTGWGIINAINNKITFISCGTIKTNPKDDISQRLHRLNFALTNIIKQYKPEKSAIEETFINNNPKSSLMLGHARGAIMLTLSLCGLNPTEYATRLIKKTVTGSGKADKMQIMTMIEFLLPGCKVAEEDAADALATAICHFNHSQINNIIGAVS